MAEDSCKSEKRHLGGVTCHKQEPFCIRTCGSEATGQEEVEVAIMAFQGPDFMY